MTLAEAIRIVDGEYNAEVAAITPERQSAYEQRLMAEYDQITSQMPILSELIGHVHDPSDFIRIAVMAIRFGMRVQRKLDNPAQVTTMLETTQVLQ